MFIKLHESIMEDKVYPSGRRYTDMEALLDFVINAHPTGEMTFDNCVIRMMPAWWGLELDGTPEMKQLRGEQLRLWLESMDQFFTLEEGIIVLENKSDWYVNPEERAEVYKAMAAEVLTIFNQLTSRKIGMSPQRERYITRRIKEGTKMTPPTGVKQFKAVFEFKIAEWKDSAEFSKYLEIETLCSDKHFYKYLEQARLAYKTKKTLVLTTFHVWTNHHLKCVFVEAGNTYKDPEVPHIEHIDKYDLYEIADRRARDYAKEKSYTYTTTPHAEPNQRSAT